MYLLQVSRTPARTALSSTTAGPSGSVRRIRIGRLWVHRGPFLTVSHPLTPGSCPCSSEARSVASMSYEMDTAGAARVADYFTTTVGKHLRRKDQRASFATCLASSRTSSGLIFGANTSIGHT